MELAFRSEQGSQPRNEDSCLVKQEQGLFLVCDGLSLKKGGNLAGQLAAEAFVSWWESNRSLREKIPNPLAKEEKKNWEEAFRLAFQEASKRIFQKATSDPELHGMCTGLDALLILGQHALIGHVGAGRVYLVRKGESHLLTEDHTQLAYLRRVGKLQNVSPQQMASYARRMTRAVGFQEDVKADFLFVELEPNDRFVVMTDGVWQTLGEETTFSLAARAGNPQQVLDSLHTTVNETGPRDNFTTLVLDPQLSSAPVAIAAEQKVKLLGKVPAFEYLSYQDLLKVLSVGDLVKVADGQTLCKEGDPGSEMMLILSGATNVMKGGQVIRTLGKGDVFGEMSMIDAAPRSATVVATAATNLLAFPRDSLFSLLREDPILSVKFLWGMGIEMNKRLRVASNRLVGKPDNEGAATEKKLALPFHRSV